jgi:hypothetical protein
LNSVESVFDQINDEIDLRVESLKCELDKIRTDYQLQAKKLKSDMILKLQSYNALQVEPYLETYASVLSSFKQSSALAKENLYLCEKYILEIKAIDLNLQHILKSTKFLPSQANMETKIVGRICENPISNVDLNRLQSSPVKLVSLPSYIKLPYYFCEIDQNLATLIDIQENEIYLLNRNFDVIRRTVIIGDFHFDTPLAMCVDQNSNVFLCDSGSFDWFKIFKRLFHWILFLRK